MIYPGNRNKATVAQAIIFAFTSLNRVSTINVLIGGYFCSRTACNFLNGTLDEVRIYNRSLSSTEIQHLYSSGLRKYSSDSWGLYVSESNLIDGQNYSYSSTACDSVGNCNSTETRSLTVDSIKPLISFQGQTPANNIIYGGDKIEINVIYGEHFGCLSVTSNSI